MSGGTLAAAIKPGRPISGSRARPSHGRMPGTNFTALIKSSRVDFLLAPGDRGQWRTVAVVHIRTKCPACTPEVVFCVVSLNLAGSSAANPAA
jgi:hypothetical protein